MDRVTGLTPVKEEVRSLPASPGVYIMKDAQGAVIYVGKASNLYNRVSSYFGSPRGLPVKTQHLVSKVKELSYIVTSSEQEALLVEANLIKKHRPYYNIRLKDDKHFPFLRIDPSEPWPRVEVTRRAASDGAYYFGPFASSRSLRRTLQAIYSIFPLRRCSQDLSSTPPRPCLYYHIGRCIGPCTGKVSRNEYATLVRQLIWFLEGRYAKVTRELKARMKEAAKAQEYEKAARLRDQIIAVEDILGAQKIASRAQGDQDVIGLYHEDNQDYVQIFFIRDGSLAGREGFVMEGTSGESPGEVMSSFIKQFYLVASYVPPVVVMQYPVSDADTICQWLKQKRKGPVQFINPRRGNRLKLVEMVAANAKEAAEQAKQRALATSSMLAQAMEEVREALRLEHPPRRMEAYDISDIQGTVAVGSMVVFDAGRPKRPHYRRFSIKTVPKANDYAMLQEVIRRRFNHLKEAEEGSKWKSAPDLILIDGGRGQLGAVMDTMTELGVDHIPVAALAKEREELFLPHQREPIILPPSSAGLQLLQRLRDEAHRFALSYHRKKRSRQSFTSTLDGIPGIGSTRKQRLLRQFGSVEAIAEAPVEEVSKAAGISVTMAQRLKQYLGST